jgi:hypothetical protein
MRSALTYAIVVFAIMTPAGVFGQTHATDRGSILVGGTASFTSSKADSDDGEENDRFNSLSIMPRALFFVAPGLALGGQLIFGRSSAGDNSSTSWGIGPEAADYFGGAETMTHPYLTGHFNYVRTSDNDDDNDLTGRQYGGGIGLLFLISSSVGIDAQAFIRRVQTSLEGFPAADAEGTIIGLQFGISAFVF